MDFSGILVLALRGIMAVTLVAFVGFALSLMWKDLNGDKVKKKNQNKKMP